MSQSPLQLLLMLYLRAKDIELFQTIIQGIAIAIAGTALIYLLSKTGI